MLTTETALMPPAPRLSGTGRFTMRVVIFLALLGFLVFVLQNGLREAFMANPGLNGLIVGVLLVGILMSLAELWRLGREISAGRALQLGDPPLNVGRLRFLTPVVPVLPAIENSALPPGQAGIVLDAVAVRLDEGRDTLRYLTGLLIFLGLLGTFWGLLETVSSVGNVIRTLRTGSEAGALFEELKAGLAAPLAGMGLSFSSSLFGVGGSLILGFLDLQVGQAQRRFRTEIEDWLSGSVVQPGSAPADHAQPLHDATRIMLPGMGAAPAAPAPTIPPELVTQLEKVAQTLGENAGSGRQTTQAMANLAEGIQGLVQHMRSEQQMIRDWVEAQSQRDKETRRLLERLLTERTRAE